MRFLWLALIAMSLPSLFAERIYFGCADGIYLANWENGILETPKLAAAAENPSFLTISPDGKFLYSVAEKTDGRVVSWSIAEDGSLTKLNEQSSGGAAPCHLTLFKNILLVANYSSGTVSSFLTNPDGTIKTHASFIQLTGSGPNPKRQKEPHAHGVYCDGNLAYVTDLGTDKLWIYELKSDATLSAITPAILPPGSGPRHLAIGKSRIYINGEMGLGVSALELESKKLLTTTPVFPSGMKLPSNADTAEIFVHSPFLYVSTRGYSSISTFKISSEGDLTFLENHPLRINGPRHFTISPDGKWMIVPGQNASRVEVLAIDPATGKLTTHGELISLEKPMCAVFAPSSI